MHDFQIVAEVNLFYEPYTHTHVYLTAILNAPLHCVHMRIWCNALALPACWLFRCFFFIYHLVIL